MGNSFKALQQSGAMKGVAAGVNSFNDTRNGVPTAQPGQSADMDELLKKLAKYFPQQTAQSQPQQPAIKVGYDL